VEYDKGIDKDGHNARPSDRWRASLFREDVAGDGVLWIEDKMSRRIKVSG
jgi:hypothetical protein